MPLVNKSTFHSVCSYIIRINPTELWYGVAIMAMDPGSVQTRWPHFNFMSVHNIWISHFSLLSQVGFGGFRSWPNPTWPYNVLCACRILPWTERGPRGLKQITNWRTPIPKLYSLSTIHVSTWSLQCPLLLNPGKMRLSLFTEASVKAMHVDRSIYCKCFHFIQDKRSNNDNSTYFHHVVFRRSDPKQLAPARPPGK